MCRTRLFLWSMCLYCICCTSVFAQSGTVVQGTVTGDGDPLPGVTVSIKGTSKGTATDQQGHYKIPVPNSNAVLVFSFVGFEKKEVPVGGRQTIDVSLSESATALKEVVAIGYGTQRREQVTSSITSVKAADFNQGIVTNPIQLIQGKVAGLSITRRNGNDPNAAPQIQLRGVSSVRAGTGPLVIIDGVPGADLNSVSQDDIESMDILKDGSAAAIYGTRGTNGVIIITTKKGKAGQARFDYSGAVSIDQITRRPHALNADQYRALAKDPSNPYGPQMKDFGANTDWFDELMVKSPVSHYHNLSVTGGSDKTTYRASLNYRLSQPIVMSTRREQYGARVNVNHRGLNDRLNLVVNLANTYAKGDATDTAALEQAVQRNPTEPVRNPDGSFLETPGYNYFNPVARMEQDRKWTDYKYLTGDAKISLDIYKGLKISLLGALQRREEEFHRYLSKDAKESKDNGFNGIAERKNETWVNRTLEPTIEYNTLINNKHSLNAVAGYSYQDFTYSRFEATNKGFISDFFEDNNMGNGTFLNNGKATLGTNKTKSQLIAFLARVNYSFADKYMLSASVRREGSSKFGYNQKWGTFPAVSAGWRISQEPFMSGISWLSDLKIRAGYGVTGNQDFDPYKSLVLLSGGGKYPINGNGEWWETYGPNRNPEPNLRWEKKHEVNAGIDFGLLKNRISGSIDVYQRTTRDLLFDYNAQIPALIFDKIFTNVGDVRNKGIEVAVTAVPVQGKKLTWTTTATFSYNQSRLMSLSNSSYKASYEDRYSFPAPGNIGTAIRLQEGQPIGNFYGKRFAGFDDNGRWLFYTAKGDKVTADRVTEEDKAVIGNGLPQMFAGWNNTIAYGNWDLTMFFRGAFGFDVLNMKEMYFGNRRWLPSNVLESVLNKHKQLNDDPQFSDYFLEKGNYVKLDNLTLGYNLKLKTDYIRNLRFYLSAQNLFTITGYSGIDPEVSVAGLEPGIDDRGFFPRTRTFTFGVNVGF